MGAAESHEEGEEPPESSSLACCGGRRGGPEDMLDADDLLLESAPSISTKQLTPFLRATVVRSKSPIVSLSTHSFVAGGASSSTSSSGFGGGNGDPVNTDDAIDGDDALRLQAEQLARFEEQRAEQLRAHQEAFIRQQQELANAAARQRMQAEALQASRDAEAAREAARLAEERAKKAERAMLRQQAKEDNVVAAVRLQNAMFELDSLSQQEQRTPTAPEVKTCLDAMAAIDARLNSLGEMDLARPGVGEALSAQLDAVKASIKSLRSRSTKPAGLKQALLRYNLLATDIRKQVNSARLALSKASRAATSGSGGAASGRGATSCFKCNRAFPTSSPTWKPVNLDGNLYCDRCGRAEWIRNTISQGSA